MTYDKFLQESLENTISIEEYWDQIQIPKFNALQACRALTPDALIESHEDINILAVSHDIETPMLVKFTCWPKNNKYYTRAIIQTGQNSQSQLGLTEDAAHKFNIEHNPVLAEVKNTINLNEILKEQKITHQEFINLFCTSYEKQQTKENLRLWLINCYAMNSAIRTQYEDNQAQNPITKQLYENAEETDIHFNTENTIQHILKNGEIHVKTEEDSNDENCYLGIGFFKKYYKSVDDGQSIIPTIPALKYIHNPKLYIQEEKFKIFKNNMTNWCHTFTYTNPEYSETGKENAQFGFLTSFIWNKEEYALSNSWSVNPFTTENAHDQIEDSVLFEDLKEFYKSSIIINNNKRAFTIFKK